MKINYFIKGIIFIFINSIFLFQDSKPYLLENRLIENGFYTKKKQSELIKENFFNKYKINPLSIFLTFENNETNPNAKEKFLILSDEQIETQDSFIARGNVIIKYKNATLKTDFIKYSKLDNTIISKGNIQYQNNNQLLKADKFVYNLTNKKGSIKNVYGLIDVITLSEDLNWGTPTNLKERAINSEITKTKFESDNIIGLYLEGDFLNNNSLNSEVKVSINKLKKWRFQSPEVLVKDQLLTAERASFTNDPFNPAQLTLESFNLKSKRKKGKLILISSWTNLNLDNKVTFPLARRTIKEDQKRLQKWGFGFDYEEKDGFHLFRNGDEFEIYDIKYRFVNEFYLQRIFENKTNVFRKKGSSITSEPVENNIDAADYLGVKLFTNSNLFGYEFNSLTSLNSLNTSRLNEAIRYQGNLSRFYDFKNIKNIKNNLFFVYRNKIDTGFEGIKEIYSSLGTNLEKNYNFKISNLDLNSNFRFQFANFNSEELNGKNLISKNRISAEAFFENRYNIWSDKNPDLFIDKTYIYSPQILNQSLDWVSKLTLTSSIYENHNNQNIIKLEIGPELQLGKLKKKYFDYTNFKAFVELIEKNGDSPFKFDNINKNERIYFELKQQVYGPLLLKAEAHYNIDNNSNDFKKLINPKFTLSFNRRAYSFEIYTIPDRKISGFNFNIFGLGYEGYGKRFKDNF